LAELPNLKLTLLVGLYAQSYYLGDRAEKTLTETVKNWPAYGPAIIPTPHPNWRITGWLIRNPWFEHNLLPVLRRRMRELVWPRPWRQWAVSSWTGPQRAPGLPVSVISRCLRGNAARFSPSLARGDFPVSDVHAGTENHQAAHPGPGIRHFAEKK